MSGIVGIVNLNREPVDPILMRRMTDFLSYRGPDQTQIWSEGSVGFGHTLLRTVRESSHEKQPYTLDGKIWITSDARIDDRATLIQKLESREREELLSVPDVQLILLAYNKWGEGCVEHLLGDFAFAIWDSHLRKLFCARDHFGIKPFYYARVGQAVIFSNTLDCLRLHPQISNKLSEQAIGDFLLFDSNQDLSSTTFKDIHRLPPAHSLTLENSEQTIKRYWTLPHGGQIRFKNPNDYVEGFKEILSRSVADRLRAKDMAVLMSGGLDSPIVALTARELLLRESSELNLNAHTIVYDELIPDQERYYSGLVAKALGIPINFFVADHYKMFERWDQLEIRGPEPTIDCFSALGCDHLRQVSNDARVALTGYGADPVLRFCFKPHTLSLLRDGHPFQALNDVWQYSRTERGIFKLALVPRLRRLFRQPPARSAYPVWLNKKFEEDAELVSRWHGVRQTSTEDGPRSQAIEFLTSSTWPNLFEAYDPGATHTLVETRHPFFDLRLIEYLWSIPGVPWSMDKTIMRDATRNLLPEEVRARKKTPLVQDPLFAYLEQNPHPTINQNNATPELADYVDLKEFSNALGNQNGYDTFWINVRPISLNHWLKYVPRT